MRQNTMRGGKRAENGEAVGDDNLAASDAVASDEAASDEIDGKALQLKIEAIRNLTLGVGPVDRRGMAEAMTILGIITAEMLTVLIAGGCYDAAKTWCTQLQTDVKEALEYIQVDPADRGSGASPSPDAEGALKIILH